LDIFIDDADIFKNLVENSLLKLTQHVSLEKQQYIEKYFLVYIPHLRAGENNTRHS
jgi:hypothetical protein